ncbi:MAG: hypothetical protein ACKO5J_01450 [Rubrivivax sp.]
MPDHRLPPSSAAPASRLGAGALPLAHRRRLRELWRSAGWPSQDLVEAELLAEGLLERVRDDAGRETLRVTDAGVQALVATLAHNRGARSLHEELVERVAREMQRAGRIAWRGLVLRAPLQGPEPGATRWAQAMPDVYSIRHTTREDLAQPFVHEIKVRRADLLADLRLPDKRAAYRALASQCWYVLRAGIAEPEEIPLDCGVLVAHAAAADPFGGRLEVLRPAPVRAHRIDFATWVALARANALPPPEEPEQAPLRGA